MKWYYGTVHGTHSAGTETYLQSSRHSSERDTHRHRQQRAGHSQTESRGGGEKKRAVNPPFNKCFFESSRRLLQITTR